MGSSGSTSKLERTRNMSSKPSSLTDLDTPTHKKEELRDTKARILSEIENLGSDFRDAKEELLKITGQRSVLNAIISYLLTVASVKQERFEEVDCQISPEYPFILMQINEPQCKELNAFKVNLVKYMAIIHTGPNRIFSLKREFQGVIEQIKGREVKSYGEIPSPVLSLGSFSERSRVCFSEMESPALNPKSVKISSSKKRIIEKVQKTIEVERYDFTINILPKLQEVLEETKTLDFLNPSLLNSGIKSIAKKYSISEKKGWATLAK